MGNINRYNQVILGSNVSIPFYSFKMHINVLKAHKNRFNPLFTIIEHGTLLSAVFPLAESNSIEYQYGKAMTKIQHVLVGKSL